jgi:hypothetical protein
LGAQVTDQGGEVLERVHRAEDVEVGAHEHGIDRVLVEPCGQAAIEVLKAVERDVARADRLEEVAFGLRQRRAAAGEQDEAAADDVVEAARVPVEADGALDRARTGERSAGGH